MVNNQCVIGSLELMDKGNFLSGLVKSEINSLRIDLESSDHLGIAIDDRLRTDFYIEYTMVCQPQMIKMPQVCLNSACKIRPYKSIESLKEDALRTSEAGFNSIWEIEIPRKFLALMDNYMLEVLDPSYSIKVIEDNKLIAMVANLPARFFQPLNLEVETIGWIWIETNISKVSRLSAHHLILNWLASRPNMLGLSVYYKNKRSINFFLKYGFEVKCVRYTRF